jgi:spore coat polysaccharide biosynthesis protein SpsF
VIKNIVIIQARMGSSRLPGKVLMPLGNSTVLGYVTSRCLQIQPTSDVIVATSNLEQDNQIEEWCQQNQVSCFRGDEEDVLARFYMCARPYSPDYIIRVTADCPFVDYDLANQMISSMKEQPSDIVILQGELPRGLAVEIISFSALEYIYKNGMEQRFREHVTYYAYEFHQKFDQTLLDVSVSKQTPKLRITLDTEEDYQLCSKVAEYFAEDKLISSQEVINYLLSHPNVASINAHIEQKPVK